MHLTDETALADAQDAKMRLPEFLKRLDAYSERVPLDLLTEWLRRLELTADDIRPHARFGTKGYQRNLLHAGSGYHALILCWRNGQRSPIHDHRGSSCGVRVIEGTLTETVFEFSANHLVFPTATAELPQGAVCGSQDADIHQVSNLMPDGRDLISLHIYSPPLLVMGTYSLTSGTVGEFADPVFQFCDGDGI